LPEIAKFVAFYKRYESLIIRGYGRLFEITNDYAKIVSQLRFLYAHRKDVSLTSNKLEYEMIIVNHILQCSQQVRKAITDSKQTAVAARGGLVALPDRGR